MSCLFFLHDECFVVMIEFMLSTVKWRINVKLFLMFEHLNRDVDSFVNQISTDISV